MLCQVLATDDKSPHVYVLVEHIECDDKLLPNGRGQGHVTLFSIFPQSFFGLDEAR